MDIEQFIRSYAGTDFREIEFYWNGKHGEDFEDLNMDFRMEVCEYLVKDFSIAPDQLILDLYQELSRSSKQTWGVYQHYHLFAQEILNRGRTKYLLHYLQGAGRSFDTRLASARIKLTDEEKQEILDYVDVQMADPANAEYKAYFEWAQERFAVQ